MLQGEGQLTICAVELKGRNITRGLTQLLAVTRDLLPPPGHGGARPRRLKACLLSTASEPSGRHYSQRRQSLESMLGADSVLVRTGLPSRTELDVTDFLRSR